MAAMWSFKCLARVYPRRCFVSTAQVHACHNGTTMAICANDFGNFHRIFLQRFEWQKQRALNGYRRCLRAAHVMFGADADNLRTKALPYIREQFENNRDLTDLDELGTYCRYVYTYSRKRRMCACVCK